MNCGPLSVVILTDSPWVRNIFLRLAMTLSAVVDFQDFYFHIVTVVVNNYKEMVS